MYLGRDFPPFQDQAARTLGSDLAKLLDDGETITAVTGRLRTVVGTDALPATHLPVAAQFSGSVVSQLVVLDDPAGMLVGNVYALSFAVTTSAARTLLPWARLRIEEGFGVTIYPGGSPPAGVQSVMLPASPLFFTIPSLLGGYAGQDFPIANQTETLAYGFDFSAALSPGETIAAAQAFLAIVDGADAAVTGSPTAYSIGSPAISGNAVTQMLRWAGAPNLTANTYALSIAARTSFNQAINAWARIVIDAVG